MVHYASRRRHGLYPHEFGPVYRLIHSRLKELTETREHFVEAEILFKILWRFDACKAGRPLYPKEITWSLIHEYINGPLAPPESPSTLIVEEGS
ncbi:hypothetical protein ES703_44113 [subsurface metagenome]